MESLALGIVTLSAFGLAQLILILALYANAVLMTKRIMPSTFGPAIQAASWYTLGVLAAIAPLSLTNFTLLQFGLMYAAILLLGISLVNGMMAYLKARKG
jgi:hypothetical protein